MNITAKKPITSARVASKGDGFLPAIDWVVVAKGDRPRFGDSNIEAITVIDFVKFIFGFEIA